MATHLIKFITIEEFEKLLKAEKKKEYKLIYTLGFGSGLRISEILGLHKQISKCCQAEVGEKKENKRILEICERCKKVLGQSDKKFIADWKIKPLEQNQVDLKAHTIKVIGGKGLKDRITITSPWLNDTNVKLLPLDISRRTVQARFTRLAKKVLNKDISIHTLRHGFANYQANEKGLPLPMLQALLGHSRLDTTGIYTRANPLQAINRAYENF